MSLSILNLIRLARVSQGEHHNLFEALCWICNCCAAGVEERKNEPAAIGVEGKDSLLDVVKVSLNSSPAPA